MSGKYVPDTVTLVDTSGGRGDIRADMDGTEKRKQRRPDVDRLRVNIQPRDKGCYNAGKLVEYAGFSEDDLTRSEKQWI